MSYEIFSFSGVTRFRRLLASAEVKCSFPALSSLSPGFSSFLPASGSSTTVLISSSNVPSSYSFSIFNHPSMIFKRNTANICSITVYHKVSKQVNTKQSQIYDCFVIRKIKNPLHQRGSAFMCISRKCSDFTVLHVIQWRKSRL